MRPGSTRVMLLHDRPTADGETGDTMRKAIFEITLAWMLVFGGSGSLLRRA